MNAVLAHRSVQGSAAAAVTLGVASLVNPLPWPLWAAWAALTAVAVAQAVRDAEGR